jgi:transmembrane sensor
LIRDALDWIVRLKSGEATLADAEQLIAWRIESAAHEQAFRNAVRCWQAIGSGLIGIPYVVDNPPQRKTDRTPHS